MASVPAPGGWYPLLSIIVSITASWARGAGVSPPSFWTGASPGAARGRWASPPVIAGISIAASPTTVRVTASRVRRWTGSVVCSAVVAGAFASATARRRRAVSVVGPDFALVDSRGWVVRSMGGGEVDTDAATVQVLAVERFNRVASTIDSLHGHEAKATRSTGAGVIHDDDLCDRSNGVELVLKVLLSGANGEAKHAEHSGRLDILGSIARLRRRRASAVGARRRRRARSVATVIVAASTG